MIVYTGVSLEPTLTDSRVRKASHESGANKVQENEGSVEPLRQDIVHPGSSGSVSRNVLWSGCFLQDRRT